MFQQSTRFHEFISQQFSKSEVEKKLGHSAKLVNRLLTFYFTVRMQWIKHEKHLSMHSRLSGNDFIKNFNLISYNACGRSSFIFKKNLLTLYALYTLHDKKKET